MDDSVSKVLEELEIQSNMEKTRQISVGPQDRMLAITKETGELLNMVLRIKKVKTMLEIGTSAGYSTIWCAEAIKDQHGKIITIEQNPSKVTRARTNFRKAKLEDFILIKKGTAMKILNEFSLDKKYKEYFELTLPMVAVGGVIVTDNMLYPEKYRMQMQKLSEHIKKYQNLKTITSPIGNGEEITLKVW